MSEPIEAALRMEHMIISLANAALPDSDPRKITRTMVETIREAIPSLDFDGLSDATELGSRLDAIARALEGYLPPETP